MNVVWVFRTCFCLFTKALQEVRLSCAEGEALFGAGGSGRRAGAGDRNGEGWLEKRVPDNAHDATVTDDLLSLILGVPVCIFRGVELNNEFM